MNTPIYFDENDDEAMDCLIFEEMDREGCRGCGCLAALLLVVVPLTAAAGTALWFLCGAPPA